MPLFVQKVFPTQQTGLLTVFYTEQMLMFAAEGRVGIVRNEAHGDMQAVY